MTRRYVSVSDHALLRFLERAGGVEVEVLRAQIALAMSRARDAAEASGGGHYRVIMHGLVYVIRDDTVVTIQPERRR